MQNEHAPFVVRDTQLIGWKENNVNMASVPVQYGYGCLDGDVNTLKIAGENVYLSTIDAGAHFARHIRNSIRAVQFKDAGNLEEAMAAGRSYDFTYPLSLETRSGIIDLRRYYELYLDLIRKNMESGFVHGNYVRPFYSPCEERKDGQQSDFQINGRVYNKTLTIMMQYWPSILGPRAPEFEGLNLLLCKSSRSPYPGTSLIEYKGESSYAPTRGPAVEEKNIFNERFGDKVLVHDVLLMDYTGTYIREASGSNVFFIASSGFVHTPNLDGSIFPGLTRDFVLRLLKGEAGSLGFTVDDRTEYTQKVRVEDAIWYSKHSGEMFLTGSALGIVPVKRLVIPRNDNPTSSEDYIVLTFKTGPDSKASMIRDCYSCFSVGDAFEVNDMGKRVRVDEFAGCPLLVEVPPELRAKAKEMLAPGRQLPIDQTMISGKVTPLRSEKIRIEPCRRIPSNV